MSSYLLELRNAVKEQTGTYTWSFTTRNEIRPASLEIGPVSVTTSTNQRQVTILSDSFRSSGKTHTLRGDTLENVLTVVHPQQKFEHPATSSSGGGTSTGTGSDADIEAIDADLLAWFDFNPARTLDVAFATATEAGDPVSYLYNRSPAPATLLYVSQYGSEFQLANVGSTVGVTRNGSWQSLADSSTPTGALTEEFSVHSLVVMPPVMGTYSYLFDLYLLKCFTWDGGSIAFKAASGANTVVPVALIPLRAYIFTIQRRGIDTTGDGLIDDYEFNWVIEDLVTETSVTHTTISGKTHPGSEQVWRLGHAATHFSHVQSCFIIHNGLDATHVSNSQKWLRNQYGAGGSGSSGETTTATIDYQLYDTRITKIPFSRPAEVIKTIRLKFEDHDGAPIDPTDAVVHLSVIPEKN